MMNDLQIRDEVSRVQSSIQQYNARKSIHVLVVVMELLIIVMSALIVSLNKELITIQLVMCIYISDRGSFIPLVALFRIDNLFVLSQLTLRIMVDWYHYHDSRTSWAHKL